MLPIHSRALFAWQFAVLLYAKEIQKAVKPLAKIFSSAPWILMGSMNASPLTKLFICLQHHLPNNGTALALPVFTTDIPQSLYSLGRENLTFINLLDTKFSCKKYRWRINMVKLTVTITEAIPNSLQFWSLGEILLLLWWRILGLISSALHL